MMEIILSIIIGLILFWGLIVLISYLYSIPASKRLEKKTTVINGIETIHDAVKDCRQSGLEGWELIEHAQKIVAQKMEYSRRNSWDSPRKAFRKGYGYCHQQMKALEIILDQLGFQTRPVHSFQVDAPEGEVHGMKDSGGVQPHTWLEVTINNETRDVDPGHPDNVPGKTHFEKVGKVMTYGPVIQFLAYCGSPLVNAIRDNQLVKKARNK